MHRSITLSEIVSSTFNNHLEEQKNYKNRKEKFVLKIGVGIIEFLVASLYQCYGIILANLIYQEIYALEQAVWTTFIYVACFYLAAPWCKLLLQNLDNKGFFPYKLIISLSSAMLAVGIVIPHHVYSYGIFGGVFSNMIHTQLKYLVRNKYKITERGFQGNIQSARAISLMIMPHVILVLMNHYTLKCVAWVYAAIILIVVPASLILKTPKVDLDVPVGMSRYQTLPAFSQQMKEMKVFTDSSNVSDVKNDDASSTKDDLSEEEVSDDDDEDAEDSLMQEDKKFSEVYLPPAPLTPTTVQVYYSHAGVSILPQIPEENEENDINVIDLKRLSRISMVLEEMNRIERKETVVQTEIVKPEPIRSIEYIPNYEDKKNVFLKDVKFSRKKSCCHCSPYGLFLWKRRLRSGKDFFMDMVVVPLYLSFGDFSFYPILASKVLLAFSSTCFLSLTPFITLKKNDGYKKEDMAFLLSYIAFSWCLSLVLLPLLMKFSVTKLRITFVVGLMFSSCSLLLLTKRKMSNDFITWSCLLFGFGYGLVRFTETTVYRTFSGKRKFDKLEGVLNTLTGCLVILIYYFMYNSNVELVDVFPLATAVCYFAVGVTWLIVPVVKEVFVFSKKYFRKRSDSGSIL